MLMVTQVLKSTAPSIPSCLLAPSKPFSAMKRNGLAASNPSAPWRTLAAFQKLSWAAVAKRATLACSMNLVKMTYQLPMLMMTRISKVPLATMSPCAHKAFRP